MFTLETFDLFFNEKDDGILFLLLLDLFVVKMIDNIIVKYWTHKTLLDAQAPVHCAVQL